MCGEISGLEIFELEDQIFPLFQKEKIVGCQKLKKWDDED